jgi:hypothetical protein
MDCLPAPGPASDCVRAGRRGRAVLVRVARPPRHDPRDRRGQGTAGRDPGTAGRGRARGRARRQVAPDPAGDRRGDADAARRGRSAAPGLVHRRTGRGGQAHRLAAVRGHGGPANRGVPARSGNPDDDADADRRRSPARRTDHPVRKQERPDLRADGAGLASGPPARALLRRTAPQQAAEQRARQGRDRGGVRPGTAPAGRPAADPADRRPGRGRLLAVLGVAADRRRRQRGAGAGNCRDAAYRVAHQLGVTRAREAALPRLRARCHW